jgi:hypothetical protein
MDQGTRYPLLFGFHDFVAGNGFVAGITLHGRALLVDEGEGFWMYGVNPGGVAAGGASLGEAQAEFRSAYRSVLFDIASEAGGFEDLKSQVERFFAETNEPTRAEWEEAMTVARKGRAEIVLLEQSLER